MQNKGQWIIAEEQGWGNSGSPEGKGGYNVEMQETWVLSPETQ